MTAVQATATFQDDRQLVRALRQGHEHAFAFLLDRYHGSLERVARTYLHDRGLAEDVVQETWLGVIRGIDSFRGDCSLKTWIYRIMFNTARTRATKEQRSVPFSALDDGAGEPVVDADRFLADGRWASAPRSWSSIPEDRLFARETMSRARDAIEALPSAQQQVITLRDVEGWKSDEVCALLGLSQANQRVLLHRARSKVRAALEDYFEAA